MKGREEKEREKKPSRKRSKICRTMREKEWE